MVPDREAIGEIDDGRARLVQAAARILLDGDGQLINDGITQKALSIITGKHPSNFQTHFADKNELVAELIDWLSGDVRVDDIEGEIAALRASVDDGGPGFQIGAAVRHFAGRFEAGSPDGERMLALLSLWTAVRNEPSLAREVNRAYTRSQTDLLFVLGAIGEQWGLKLRSPWTPDSLIVILRALLYGIEVQEAARPGTTEGLVGLTLISLLPAMTRFEHDEEVTVDGLVAQMGSAIEAYWTNDETAALTPGGRAALFDALESQLEDHGYIGTQLSDVAARANLSYESVARAMGNLDQVICRRLLEVLGPLAQEIPFDRAAELFSNRDLVVRHLDRLESTARSATPFARAVLAMMTGGGEPSPAAGELLGELAQPLIAILNDASQAGELMELDSGSAGVSLVAGTLMRVCLGGAVADPPLDLSASFWRNDS